MLCTDVEYFLHRARQFRDVHRDVDAAIGQVVGENANAVLSEPARVVEPAHVFLHERSIVGLSGARVHHVENLPRRSNPVADRHDFGDLLTMRIVSRVQQPRAAAQ